MRTSLIAVLIGMLFTAGVTTAMSMGPAPTSATGSAFTPVAAPLPAAVPAAPAVTTTATSAPPTTTRATARTTGRTTAAQRTTTHRPPRTTRTPEPGDDDYVSANDPLASQRDPWIRGQIEWADCLETRTEAQCRARLN